MVCVETISSAKGETQKALVFYISRPDVLIC